jgi:CRP-like cAMP-binding protein
MKDFTPFITVRNNFLRRVHLSEEELDLICNLLEVRKVKKKKAVLVEGNISDSVIYVNKGLLRMYTNDKQNYEEQTFDFGFEDHWFADLEGFRSKQTSKVNIEAMEDCELFLLHFNDVVRLHTIIPNLERFSRYHAEEKYIEAINRLKKINHPNYSAKERYLTFMELYPETANRIPSMHLASYLGIASETLSRIKRELGQSK